MKTVIFNCCKNIHVFFHWIHFITFKKHYKKNEYNQYNSHVNDTNVIVINHDPYNENSDPYNENSDDSDYDDWVIKNIYYKT